MALQSGMTPARSQNAASPSNGESQQSRDVLSPAGQFLGSHRYHLTAGSQDTASHLVEHAIGLGIPRVRGLDSAGRLIDTARDVGLDIDE